MPSRLFKAFVRLKEQGKKHKIYWSLGQIQIDGPAAAAALALAKIKYLGDIDQKIKKGFFPSINNKFKIVMDRLLRYFLDFKRFIINL